MVTQMSRKCNPIVGLGTLVVCNLICQLQAMNDKDIVLVEESISYYYDYIGKQTWKWERPITVTFHHDFCPKGFRNVVGTKLGTLNVMLESQGCKRIPMDILELTCEANRSQIAEDQARFSLAKFALGVNSEAYEVSPPGERTKCDDVETLTIERCANNGRYISRDYFDVEKVFSDNRDVLSLQGWDLPPDDVCTQLNSTKYILPYRGEVVTMDLTLESQDCAQIPMKILKCFSKMGHGERWYARGRFEEVHRVMIKQRQSKCSNEPLLTMTGRVIDDKGHPVRPLCPS